MNSGSNFIDIETFQGEREKSRREDGAGALNAWGLCDLVKVLTTQ